MEDAVSLDSRVYWVMLALLLFGRGMDFLSTWTATPNLVLEGNPLAKKMGWKFGIPVNVALSVAAAFYPLMAIIITTTSVLVAARNFQSAWLMRSMGEEAYRDWYVSRLRETGFGLFMSCLLGQTLLIAAVGAGLVGWGRCGLSLAVGLGILAYAVAVLFYTLLSVWRIRRGMG